MSACQILLARRAQVTPQRKQSEETHGTPPGRVALAGNRPTTSRAVIANRQTADLVPFQFDFEVLTDWRTLLRPLRLEVCCVGLCHFRSTVRGSIDWRLRKDMPFQRSDKVIHDDYALILGESILLRKSS